MSSIHLELLDNKRREAFKRLKVFQKTATLAGGTALLLQIGHRQSFDFDLFLEREVKRSDYLKLKKHFDLKEVKIKTGKQLTVITDKDIGITLVRYDYKALFKKVSSPFLSLYSIKDIAADKAFTIGQRAVWRDYVDLFFILKWDYLDIINLVRLSKKKFGVEFNIKLFLEQLIYFDDLKIVKTVFIKEQYSKEEIQDFLKARVKEYRDKKLKA